MSGIDCRHSICDECWGRMQPGRTPVRTVEEDPEPQRCCYCGVATLSGIFVHDPAHERCLLEGWSRFGSVRFTRILELEFSGEILCWRRRVMVSDGTVYEGNEVGAPLATCMPYLTEAEREIVRGLPHVKGGGS